MKPPLRSELDPTEDILFHSFPMPTATEEDVATTQDVYRREYKKELTGEQARTLIEGLIYTLLLTYYTDAIRHLRSQEQ